MVEFVVETNSQEVLDIVMEKMGKLLKSKRDIENIEHQREGETIKLHVITDIDVNFSFEDLKEVLEKSYKRFRVSKWLSKQPLAEWIRIAGSVVIGTREGQVMEEAGGFATEEGYLAIVIAPISDFAPTLEGTVIAMSGSLSQEVPEKVVEENLQAVLRRLYEPNAMVEAKKEANLLRVTVRVARGNNAAVVTKGIQLEVEE